MSTPVIARVAKLYPSTMDGATRYISPTRADHFPAADATHVPCLTLGSRRKGPSHTRRASLPLSPSPQIKSHLAPCAIPTKFFGLLPALKSLFGRPFACRSQNLNATMPFQAPHELALYDQRPGSVGDADGLGGKTQGPRRRARPASPFSPTSPATRST